VAACFTALAAGVLAPTPAGAAPSTADEARDLVEKAALQLTAVDEQVHEAELIVAQQQEAAAAAGAQAAVAQEALAAFEPQLRAIAQSGYTGKTQSRVAAFLTSESAADLVQQMTTLDLIASHTEAIVAQAAAAQDAAEQAQAAADQAAADAQAGLEELERQKAQLQEQIDAYQADFARLSAAEQAAVTAAIAGPQLAAPSVADLPVAPGAVGTAIQTALSKVGSPYAWGASGPNSFDCSGFTRYAFAAVGMNLPHSSRAQYGLGVPVSRAELQPGDLVFFAQGSSVIDHVGLYIGNGMMVHARTYGTPASVTSVDMRGYVGARRIVTG
jgi:cell wall-associated NlpC family hydrolase